FGDEEEAIDEDIDALDLEDLEILAESESEIMLLAAANPSPGELVVKNANGKDTSWDIPLLGFVSSSVTGGPVKNYVKYIADDAENGWRLAYCTQISKHFVDSTTYISQTWEASGMYSEISG